MQRSLYRLLSRTILLVATLALVATGVWFWLRPVQVTLGTVTERKLSSAIQGVGTVEAKVVMERVKNKS